MDFYHNRLSFTMSRKGRVPMLRIYKLLSCINMNYNVYLYV